MAPVDIHTPPSLLPTAFVVSHLVAIGYVGFVAGRSIYRSYVTLPPSSATRHREPSRKGHVKTFSILALLSYAFAAYYAVRFASLSYRVWAAERGVELPDGLFGDRGALRGGQHPGRLEIVRWLCDTPFYRDALEIVAEKARHLWWGRQVNLGLVAWSLYLAIEGQRRNISNLWAFMVLSQLVSLSFAQNLFFVAVLLTPVPLPENVRELTRNSVPATSSWYTKFLKKYLPTKPEGFIPNQNIYIFLLVSTLITVKLISLAMNTTSFMTIATLSRLLPFSFLALPYVIPESWGKVYAHPHGSHKSYTTLFQLVSLMSAYLYLESSFLALFYNTPDNTYYRHSLLHPFKEEHRSTFDRRSIALGRVFGAIFEHPAVSAVGWDVLLSGLSLGIWAAIRGLDAQKMLASSVLFTGRAGKVANDTTRAIAGEAENEIENIDPPTPRRRSGRPKKNEEADGVAPRRRGRPSKKSLELTNGVDEDDKSYEPTESEQLEEGDEDAEEDWEMGALAWGLLSIGGLGMGSAAVYGGEILGR